MDGSNMLKSNELPAKFFDILLWQGSIKKKYDELVINTGDIFYTSLILSF
jgi:hypothetical protein